MLQCGYETDQRFYDRIRHVATTVRNKAVKVARRAFHHVQQTQIDLGYYVTLSESAVFLAFIEFGGDVDAPESFAWAEHHDRLATVAAAHVRRDLQDAGSESHDLRLRLTNRLGVQDVDSLRWDSWQPQGGEEREDREMLASALEPLLPELKAQMLPRDFEILCWAHLERRSWAEIAQRLGITVGGAKRAGTRARARAADILGPRWQTLVLDSFLAVA